MEDLRIRPTEKFVKAGALFLLFIAVVGWGCRFAVPGTPLWLPVALTLLLLWPLVRWIPIRTSVTTVTADRVHSESGVLSKSTRTLMRSRVQDIGVTQSLAQRMLNVGDIWIETAGASSRVILKNIDSPQKVVNLLLGSPGGAA